MRFPIVNNLGKVSVLFFCMFTRLIGAQVLYLTAFLYPEPDFTGLFLLFLFPITSSFRAVFLLTQLQHLPPRVISQSPPEVKKRLLAVLVLCLSELTKAPPLFINPALAPSSSGHKPIPSRSQKTTSCGARLMPVGADQGASAFYCTDAKCITDFE